MASFIETYYNNRIFKQNKNWLAVVCGETGSGKSYSALKMAEMCDPSFNVNRVIYTPEDFMSVLDTRLKSGNIIIWDEAGVGLPAREWYSISNKAIDYVLQTFRHENLGVIFTTPSFSFIDVQARKLFHSYFETQFINYNAGYVRLKWLLIQDNPRLNKIYYHYPKHVKDGRTITISRVNIYKPSDKLIKAYEKKKKNYTRALKENTKETIASSQKKEIDLDEVEEMIRANPEPYIKEYKQRRFVDPTAIMNEFGIGSIRAKKVKERVERDLLNGE
ncbi:MAG: zonular occludens toxin domain-containing protein [Candidatus Thermoplasmatota archaeon]|nr:zonular occludens toxin domain-containing protein [Candidatus Thermoplasmatota archaeon]